MNDGYVLGTTDEPDDFWVLVARVAEHRLHIPIHIPAGKIEQNSRILTPGIRDKRGITRPGDKCLDDTDRMVNLLVQRPSLPFGKLPVIHLRCRFAEE